MGEEIAITFETLYDILMREKQREEILPLEQNFFPDVIIYLGEKIKVWEKISNDNDLFSIGEREKVETEIKNIRRILKDIYERREKKIIGLALNKSRIGHSLGDNNLLMEEKQLFDSLAALLDTYRQGVLLNLLKMQMPKVEDKKVVVELKNEQEAEKPKDVALVRFVLPVPKFVGTDMAIYGPFDEDDTASLPKDVANILINKKKAEELKTKN